MSNIPGGATIQPTYTTGANPRAKNTPANNTYATLKSSNKNNSGYGQDRYPTVIYSRTATTGDWKLVLTVYGEHLIFYNGSALNKYFPNGFSMDILNGRLRTYVYDTFLTKGYTVKTNDKGTQYLNNGSKNLLPVWIMGAWDWTAGKLIYYFDNFNPATNTSTYNWDNRDLFWDVGYEAKRQNYNKETGAITGVDGDPNWVDTIEFNDADGSLLTYSSRSSNKYVTNIWGPTYLYGRTTGVQNNFNMPRTAPLYSKDWQYRLSLDTTIVPDANGNGFAPNLILQKYVEQTPTLGSSGDPYKKTIWMTNNCNSGNNLDPVGFTSNQQYLPRSYAVNFRGSYELCIINNMIGPLAPKDKRGGDWESKYIWTNMKNPRPSNVAPYVVCYMQEDGNICIRDYYSETNYWCSNTYNNAADTPSVVSLDPRYSLQLAKKYTLDRFIFVNNDNYVGELYFDKGTSPEFPSTTNCTIRMRKDLETMGWRFSYITQILDGSFLMVGLNNMIYKAPVGPTIRYISEHGFIKDGAGADKPMISINQIQDGRFLAVGPGNELWVSTGNNYSDRFNIVAFDEFLFDIKQLIDMTWLVTIDMKNYTEWDVTRAPNVKYSFLLPATFGIPVTVATGKCITNYISSQKYKNNLVSPLYTLSADGTSYSRIVTSFGESIVGGLVNIDYGNTTSLPGYYQIPNGTTIKYIIPAYNGYKLCMNYVNNIGMLHVGNNLSNNYSNIEYSKVSKSGANYSSSTANLLGTNIPVPPPPVGTFVGAGGDGNLYTVSSLLSTVEQPGMWTPTGKGSGIVYIVQLNDKTFACVNSAGIIYTSPSVDPNDNWALSPSPARLDSLINLKDNTFAGIGYGTYQIYTSPSIINSNNWSGQNNTTPLVRLTQLNDGSFAGILKDSLTVSTSPTITGGGTWTPTNSPANLINLIQLMDGSFAGVGTDNYVYKCNDKTLASTNVWTKIPGSCCVKCIIQIKF
jgi:hypothetical protein